MNNQNEPSSREKDRNPGIRDLLSGYYWWRPCEEGPWRIVEVFQQDGKWLVARMARWVCFDLHTRNGEWGAMIADRSLSGYCRAFALNSWGAALAGIESLQAWAAGRKRKGHPSAKMDTAHEYLENLPLARRLISLGAVNKIRPLCYSRPWRECPRVVLREVGSSSDNMAPRPRKEFKPLVETPAGPKPLPSK